MVNENEKMMHDNDEVDLEYNNGLKFLEKVIVLGKKVMNSYFYQKAQVHKMIRLNYRQNDNLIHVKRVDLPSL
jgi:hypothetical protein